MLTKLIQKIFKRQTKISGHVLRFRRMGGIILAQIQDCRKNIVQIMIKKEQILHEDYESLSQTLKIGDLISFRGETFIDLTGERSILVKKLY